MSGGRLLHTGLPLRHPITTLSGSSGSANALSGPAGRLLPRTQSLPYHSNLTPLSRGEFLATLGPEVVADLSWDQQNDFQETVTSHRAIQIIVTSPSTTAAGSPPTTGSWTCEPGTIGWGAGPGEPEADLPVHHRHLLQAVVPHLKRPQAGGRASPHAEAGPTGV